MGGYATNNGNCATESNPSLSWAGRIGAASLLREKACLRLPIAESEHPLKH
jgi:hypothetical protein